ncbi:glycosyltransferase family 1 protein [Legionella sp. PC1000]|uniref:glycosyltransferase n=1 Tax=Legionella sp. PC1000 TaxID=2746060 RepID=UPI0015FB805E|nr:glycosyltransferase [Legionella sp. PC1000]QLZ67406.1 glycosyltransferase family 1 protein [Legionella sp. PC1000]
MLKNKFLFNFSVSYLGGGVNRLVAYAKWFNQNGGAYFIIHPLCQYLVKQFPNNQYIIIKQSKLQRLFNDCFYLKDFQKQIGTPEFYYSYGIPIYYKFGKINWFHLSNILPLCTRNIPLSLFDKLKFTCLGARIKKNFAHADVISAESNFSLSFIDDKYSSRKFLSMNGSDKELSFLNLKELPKERDNIATVIGTYRYKAVEDSFHVYESLRKNNPELKLIIIGDEKSIPASLKSNKNIIIKGFVPREEVLNSLLKTKYYISTTHIENSSNGVSEGVFLADESYISDIGPHRELLKGMSFETLSIENLQRTMLHIKKENISARHLKTWDEVVEEMLFWGKKQDNSHENNCV